MRLCIIPILILLLNCQLSFGAPTIPSPSSSAIPGDGLQEKEKGLQETKSDLAKGNFNSSNICKTSSQCFVFPENCVENCEIMYSVEKGRSRLFVGELVSGSIISLQKTAPLENSKKVFSCFELMNVCFYGIENRWGTLEYSFKTNSMIYPLSWYTMPENKSFLTFNHVIISVGKKDKIRFRIDQERDASGPFKELFLRSHD
ncbi:unnamed protein product [Caenorhabditis nigoni]|uniref:SUN domain-containing protein n=1 Tax=Caenorhabditis nigoni TaxID=1611254 RepID=A0A2G5SVD8_9PELO|nr:hypothetical protein B9Z55_024634 [Caenorhabditis nigoni]